MLAIVHAHSHVSFAEMILMPQVEQFAHHAQALNQVITEYHLYRYQQSLVLVNQRIFRRLLLLKQYALHAYSHVVVVLIPLLVHAYHARALIQLMAE
jgi:hypothetical protein